MKTLLIFFFSVSLFFSPAIALGFNVSDIVDHKAPEAYFFQQEFDKLVLDITIPSGNAGSGDKLSAIALQNDGKALYSTEIREFTLWEDAAKTGFQGLGVDKKIGTLIFEANVYSWYLNNLSVAIPKEGKRFFVSVEITKAASANTTFQMKVPFLQDQNKNGLFETGDLGIFLESKNNGPQDGALVNTYMQVIRRFSVDNLSPKVVISDSLDGASIATSTYKIKGVARDQGGSTPQWVKIAINEGSVAASTGNWQEVKPIGDNYSTWEYDWTAVPEGAYNIKTKAADWFDNVAISETIFVTVAFPKPQTPTTTQIAAATTTETTATAAATTATTTTTETAVQPVQTVVEVLQAKITALQELIAKLMLQLIELIKTQIAELKK